ncbi:AAA domain-containing protein [Desulfobacula sp.]|uniref:AAA domain-containing protein n=1 Tax=Desulfobacula sp. TaxID=2593537 RepID=UPI0026053F42|nr:AAA domain-containing protein [Desulfobacula sp.]
METKRIFLKGIDQTNEIESLDKIGDKYIVRFKNNETPYPYSSKNVTIETKSNDPFEIYTSIAQDTKAEDGSSVLGRYCNGIKIKENSLLHKYLNGAAFENFNDEEPLIFPFRFNISQLEATKSVFKNELSVIQGPPGTGKTQTILNIIANVMLRGKNVALVSNNNAAVDNVRDKLNKYNYGYIYAQLGRKEKQEKFFLNQSNIIREIVPNQLDSEDLKRTKNELLECSTKLRQLMKKEREQQQIKEKLNALRLEQAYYNNVDGIDKLDERLYISFYNLGHEKILDFLVDHRIMISNKEKLNFISKFKLFAKYGVYKFKELQENNHEVISRFQKVFYKLKIKELENKLKQCERILGKGNFLDLAEKHSKVSKTLFDHYLSQRFKEERKKYTIKKYKKVFDSFINDYPIILSTAYSITNSAANGFVFDYVIVDEASTLDLVKAMLPLSCAEKIIIVGDQKQLPHIPEKTEHYFENEAYDYQKQNIMSSLDVLYGERLQKTLLKEHYRCHPDIIRFCNMNYYNGELIVYTKAENSAPINVIKTAPGNHMREITRGKRGPFNQRELEELNNLIDNKKDYKFSLYSQNLDDIGLITPYRKQVKLSEKLNPSAIEKDTVHKYQGREKPVIVFSTILDQSAKSNFKMRFVDDPQMVNVAVSRAEKQLIIISNADAFYKKNGNNIGDLLRYIEYHDKSNIENGRVISVFDLLYKDFSERLWKRKLAMSNVKKNISFKSELIIYSILKELLSEEAFICYSFSHEVRLADIFLNRKRCSEIEKKFIKQPRSSVDFLISNKFDKSPVLAIEVDGTEFHLNNPEQQLRDQKKDDIFNKYDIPILRLETHASITKDTLKDELTKLTEIMIA